MITLGAQVNFDYAEQITTKHVNSNSHVDDPSQLRQREYAQEVENEETEKQPSNFAEILAGLLNGSVQSAEISAVETDESLNLDGLNSDISLSDFDFSEIALSEEDENLLSARSELDDQFLAGFFEEMQAGLAKEGAERDLLKRRELSEIANEEALKKASLSLKNEKSKTDLSDTALNSKSDSSLSAAMQGSEEALAAENAAKKKSASLEDIAKLTKADQLANADAAKALASAKKSGEENSFAHNGKEETGGKLDELRSRSRKDKISFEIRDQRTMTDTASRSFSSVEASAGRMADLPSANDITLELRLPDFNNSGQASQTTWETKATNAMESMLSRELHNNFNGDIVRHASMALRDGGESVIRLALRPDSLGNVKIRLEMTDNKVTGIIMVESEEALNAFRKEIASLEQAFKEAGFAEANLDLSFNENGNAPSDTQREYEENAFSAQFAASGYEDTLREIELNTEAMMDALLNGGRQSSVNMLA